MERTLALLMLPIVLALAACGLSASVSEESDPYRDEQNYSRSVSFSSEDQMEQAQRLTASRNFAGAIAIYEKVYQSDPDDETRAEALMRWAQAEHSPFNPDRDADAAAARLRLLLENYPNSGVAPEASTTLDAWSN